MRTAALFCALFCAGAIFECLCLDVEDEEVSVSGLRYLYDLWFGYVEDETRSLEKRSIHDEHSRHRVTTRKPSHSFGTGHHNRTSTHTSNRHTTRRPITVKTTRKPYVGHNKTIHKATTRKPIIVTTKKSHITQGWHNRTHGGRNKTITTKKPFVVHTTRRHHVSNNHTVKSPYFPSAPPMDTLGNQMHRPPSTDRRQPSAPPMETSINHQRFDHMRQPSAPPSEEVHQQQMHRPPDLRQPSAPPMPGNPNYGWNLGDNGNGIGWQVPTDSPMTTKKQGLLIVGGKVTTHRPIVTTKRQGFLIVGGKVTTPRPIVTTKRHGLHIVGGKVTTPRPTTTTVRWHRRTTTKRRRTKPSMIAKKITPETYYPSLFPSSSYNPQNYNPSWFSSYPANYHPNQPVGYHPSSNVYYGPATIVNGHPAPSYSYQAPSDTSILGDIVRHRTERMFTYSTMPHYKHHTYHVHHYHKEKMENRAPAENLWMNATALVPCPSNVSLLCLDGTFPVCLGNGTVMCAVDFAATVRCGHNPDHHCLPSKLDCTRTTDPGCDGFTVDAKINVPCLYNVSLAGNQTVAGLFGNASPISGGLGNMTNVHPTGAGNTTVAISGTLGNMTNVYPANTTVAISGTLGNMTNVYAESAPRRNSTTFCVVVSAEPSQLKTDRLDEVKPLKTPVMENIVWNIMKRFAEHIWGD